jgi:hypothetical protein
MTRELAVQLIAWTAITVSPSPSAIQKTGLSDVGPVPETSIVFY